MLNFAGVHAKCLVMYSLQSIYVWLWIRKDTSTQLPKLHSKLSTSAHVSHNGLHLRRVQQVCLKTAWKLVQSMCISWDAKPFPVKSRKQRLIYRDPWALKMVAQSWWYLRWLVLWHPGEASQGCVKFEVWGVSCKPKFNLKLPTLKFIPKKNSWSSWSKSNTDTVTRPPEFMGTNRHLLELKLAQKRWGSIKKKHHGSWIRSHQNAMPIETWDKTRRTTPKEKCLK